MKKDFKEFLRKVTNHNYSNSDILRNFIPFPQSIIFKVNK